MSLPALFLLEFARTEQADDTFAYRYSPQTYTLRAEGGALETLHIDWSAQLLADLDAVRQEGRDPARVQRLGDRLASMLKSRIWHDYESQILERVKARTTGSSEPAVILTIRSSAAEIYTLPWELLTLCDSGERLGELRGVLVRYEWPKGSAPAHERRTSDEPGRILFAYSSAGGQVPAGAHLDCIRRAASAGFVPFAPERDVIDDVSCGRLIAALESARISQTPISVLHILCHGGTYGSTCALLLNNETPSDGPVRVDAAWLRQHLAPYADMVRLVVLMACDSGNSGELGNHLGSIAQTLHRAGFSQVVASRFPLSITGSICFTQTFYTELLGALASVEQALLRTRAQLSLDSTQLDWAGVQLYAQSATGTDSRPIRFRPYCGLLAFQPEQQRFFFGRDREVAELVADWKALHTQQKPRLLAVDGASGTGKSSVLFAGALPQLRAVLGEGTTLLRMRPGSDPNQALTEALTARRPNMKALLIIDQFEEVFTQSEDRTAQTTFAAKLWELCRSADAGISIVLTIRSDFVGRCGELVLDESGLRLDRVLYDEGHRVSIAQMNPAQLRQVIEMPAQRVGLQLENGLTERMLAAVDSEPGALPLLADVLDQLWQQREGNKLTQAAYDRLGGVTGALHGRADQLISALSTEEQLQARRLLVRLGSGFLDLSSGVRQRIPIAARRPVDSAAAQHFDRALSRLVAARLIVLDLEGKEPMVEVAHEAVLRKWPLLARWAQEDRAQLEQLDTLEAWVRQWQQHKTLLSGDQLGYAVQVASRYGEALSTAARQLLHESQAERARMEDRDRYARDCLRMLAVNGLTQDPTRQVALLREMESKNPAAVPGWLGATIDLMQVNALTIAETLEHPHPIRCLRLSPDGERFLTACPDGTARIFGINGECQATLSGHAGGISWAEWSPDGSKVVTASADHTAMIWSDEGGVCLSGHTGAVSHAAWSPDGSQLATASADGTVRIWQAQEPPIVLEEAGAVLHVAWSPDGHCLVCTSDAGHARLWKVGEAGKPVTLGAHDAPVSMAAWNSSGSHIVTVSGTTASIWSKSSPRRPVILAGCEEGVAHAAFSPDGKTIALALKNGRVLLYPAPGGGEPTVLVAGRSPLSILDWSPDGQRILAASEDGCAYLFSMQGVAAPIYLRGHVGVVRCAVFSPDGSRIVSCASDGKARTWDAARSQLLIPSILTADADTDSILWYVDSQSTTETPEAQSPDGQLLASVTSEWGVEIRTRDDDALRMTIPPTDAAITGLTFSPDSQLLIAFCSDNCARLYPLTEGEPVTLRGHTSSILCADISPDGRRVVTGSWDWKARVWNRDGSGEARVLEGHTAAVTLVAFSPDGNSILTMSDDGCTRLWFESTCVTLLNAGQDYGVGIRRDFRRIVTELADKTRLLWDLELDPVRLIERLWRATPFCLSIAERERYLLEPHDLAVRNFEASRSRIRHN